MCIIPLEKYLFPWLEFISDVYMLLSTDEKLLLYIVSGGSQWGCSKHGKRLKNSRFHDARLIFTSNYCSELRKSYKQHGHLDKIIHDTRLIFSLFHDTRLIFLTFHATRLTPLRPSFSGSHRRPKLKTRFYSSYTQA